MLMSAHLHLMLISGKMSMVHLYRRNWWYRGLHWSANGQCKLHIFIFIEMILCPFLPSGAFDHSDSTDPSIILSDQRYLSHILNNKRQSGPREAEVKDAGRWSSSCWTSCILSLQEGRSVWTRSILRFPSHLSQVSSLSSISPTDACRTPNDQKNRQIGLSSTQSSG